MRKIAKMITACILITINGLFANNFEEGQQLTVMAPSGLSLRTAPTINSRVLDIIPYGSEIKVIKNTFEDNPFDKFDWVEGTWIKVNFEGQEGFVFDGFISKLPMPNLQFEKVEDDFDFSYAVESWLDYRFMNSQASDTIVTEDGLDRVMHYYENDQYAFLQDQHDYFKLTVNLKDIRIMDAYHLLLSMTNNKIDRKYVEDQSLFIEDIDGGVMRIKIQLDNPVVIDRKSDGSIKMSLISIKDGCNLAYEAQ